MPDLDRYQYGYDQNSNRLWKANVVGMSLGALHAKCGRTGFGAPRDTIASRRCDWLR
jgi:hypothetical protein